MKHLIRLWELSSNDILDILQIAVELKKQCLAGQRPSVLQNRVLTQVFEKPSLRTRTSNEAAMAQLGGQGIFFTAKDAGFQGREDPSDIAQVLSRFSDLIVLRTFSQQKIADFAQAAYCPVINGLSDEFHPTQALSDLLTIQEHCGNLRSTHLVYIGDGNNMARSLVVAAAHVGQTVTICTPEHYALADEFRNAIRQKFPNAKIEFETDPILAVKHADVIYTDVWASMGQEAEGAARRKIFQPYQINTKLQSQAPANHKVMHCLPAHRGEEITADVVDGPNSIVFDQSENRMHLAKGLFVWLLQ